LWDVEDDVLLAAIVYGEARGEPFAGKLGVAFVAHNRAEHPSWWGREIKEVLLKPMQFSCVNDGDPNLAEVVAATTPTASHLWGDIDFRECKLAAFAVLNGWARDLTNGANHYHAIGVSPNWAAGREPTAVIGRHRFFKL
jgi:spore germination cell wall hydrolase CwlJ-like protein